MRSLEVASGHAPCNASQIYHLTDALREVRTFYQPLSQKLHKITVGGMAITSLFDSF